MSSQPGKSAKRRGLVVAAAIAGGMFLLVGGAYGIGYAMSGETLPPQTTIEGIPVGGMTPPEAEAALAAAFAPRTSADLTLVAGDLELAVAPNQVGVTLDVAASVEAAMAHKSFHPGTIWTSLTGGGEHPAVVTRDAAALTAVTDELSQLANRDPQDAAITVADAKATLVNGNDGLMVDVAATQSAMVDKYLHADRIDAVVQVSEPDVTTEEATTTFEKVAKPALSGPITLTAADKSVEITPKMIAAALSFEAADGGLKPVLDSDKLSKAADTALQKFGLSKPEDATIKLVNGKPSVTPSKDGTGIAKKELLRVVTEKMTSSDSRTADIKITEEKAKFSTADAKKLGVKEVTGEFTTSFPASAYRINNIGKSARLINHTFLKPGETFSMNAALGPRTLANGWMAGGAIDGGRVVQRMGGGISQTTTTLFNAIFFAGLEDIYHKPHSLYFSRYPMGREATLDYYSVDMKFRNNSDYGVLIQAFTNNPAPGGSGKVTVRIWSTKVYDVKATKPVQSNVNSGGATIRDNSAVCSPQSAMKGFRVDYKRQFYQGGKLVRSEPFTWTYKSLTPVVCTNPNARPDRIER
ncbi:MAG: VanW family protein [Propioniciclava sp.]